MPVGRVIAPSPEYQSPDKYARVSCSSTKLHQSRRGGITFASWAKIEMLVPPALLSEGAALVTNLRDRGRPRIPVPCIRAPASPFQEHATLLARSWREMADSHGQELEMSFSLRYLGYLLRVLLQKYSPFFQPTQKTMSVQKCTSVKLPKKAAMDRLRYIN